jgi:4-hydroxy-tetrahydrodipicolinate reductase
MNKEKIYIALSGSKGRMGQCIQAAVLNNPQYVLSAEFFSAQNDVLSAHALENPIDVWIDFSHPEASLRYCALCCEQGYKMVIGTTGFSEDQKAFIVETSKSIPILFSPNMSIGHALMLKMVEMLAKVAMDSDVGIIDIHHKHKKDAPSGTALALAKLIRQAGAMDPDIVSLRLGESIGEHQALFALKDESIRITHTVQDRKVFAEGALKAAQWLCRVQKPGFYTMQNVLGV